MVRKWFNVFVALAVVTLSGCGSMKTTTEKDEVEVKSISSVSNYTDSIKYAIQVVNVDLTKVLQMYPALQEKNVGLGFAESVLDYLDETGRFVFTEEKSEIKERMVTQFKASKKGIFEEPIDGKGKIKAARYFVYVTVADFAVDEDESIAGAKGKVVVTTFIRLQVRFVDAKTGQIYIGSGEGEATKTGESFLKSLDGMKFSQSTVGKATRKSLETATTKVIENLIKNGVFKN
jgi:curli biogenesis system outer membrane secretion channel CsgG